MGLEYRNLRRVLRPPVIHTRKNLESHVEYTQEKIEKILTMLDIAIDHVDGDEVYAQCPGHFQELGRVDRTASWSINSVTGLHKCFSCGYSGGLTRLVADNLPASSTWGVPSYQAAKDWITNTVGMDVSDIQDRFAHLQARFSALPKPVQMSEARLSVFSPPPLLPRKERGLSAESCFRYGVLWDEVKQAWITPIRDLDTNALLGWQEKGQGYRYFNNRPVNVRKSSTLFFPTVRNWIDVNNYGNIRVVVESPLDAVRLDSVGVNGGIATFGASLSDTQREHLISGSHTLYVAMDNDAAGKKAAKDLFDYSRKVGVAVFFFRYEEGGPKDVGDMSPRQIQYGMDSAETSMFGWTNIEENCFG